ncbi:MAG TPA: polysaccharide biosynthesis C-terminal domain-containing protein [Herpetosiphonaceae bacterium]
MSASRPQSSLSERVAGAIFWNTVAFPIKAAIKFLAGLVLLWALLPEGYGLFQAAVGAVVATVWTFTGLGISPSILKFVPEVMARQGSTGVARFLRQLFLIRLGFLLIVVLLLNIFSADVLGFLRAQASGDYARMLSADGLFLLRVASAIVLLRVATDTCARTLVAYFKQKTTNSLDIVSALVQPVLTVLLVPAWGLGMGIRGAALAILIGSTVDLLLALFAVRRALRHLPAEHQTIVAVERLWQRFSSSALMNYVMDQSVFVTSPDFVALVFLWLARPAALANIEAGWNQVLVLLTYLVMPLNGIYVPMFSEIFAKGDDHKLQPAYATLTRALLLATVPAGIGFITLAPQAFELLHLAAKYPQAAAVAQVVTLFLFAESIVVVPHVILMVYERYRVVALSRLLAVLSAPLIVLVAINGSAVTTALAIGVFRFGSRAVLTPYASRAFGLRFPWRFAGRLALPSLLFMSVLTLLSRVLPVLESQPVWRNLLHLAALIGVGVAIFAAGFKLMGGIDDDDRKRLATMRIPLRKLILRYL